MGNMLDYLDWRGDLTLEQSAFNEVDNLILSQLVYVNFDYIVPPIWSEADITVQEAAEQYFQRYSEEQIAKFSYVQRISIPLLRKLQYSPRFAHARLSKFENMLDLDRTKQFAAMHVELGDGTIYISYRGTDNNIVGWKENFNMSVGTPVPAQYEAVRYLEDTTEESEALLRIGGHSKGGNLAIYAAVMCKASIKSRIVEVFNNDGPGFEGPITKSSAYKEMLGRIRTIAPQSSVVGMLLEHEEEYTIVQSNRTLLMQHEAFSWEVLGASFIRAEQVEKKSELLDTALKAWLSKLNKLEREQFIAAVFYIFEAGDIRTLEDLSRAKWKKVNEMIRALNASQENKIVLTKTLKLLLSEGRKAFLSIGEKQG